MTVERVRAYRNVLAVLAASLVSSPLAPTAMALAQATGPADTTLIAAAREIMAASRYAALITLSESGSPRARTMDPFAPDSLFVVWLGTIPGSRKVQDIRRDSRVALYYQHPEGMGYVTLEGTARLVDDAAEKARRWKDEWARFYPDRDASYLLIAVTPVRLEVVDYLRGVQGDATTWRVPAVEFERH